MQINQNQHASSRSSSLAPLGYLLGAISLLATIALLHHPLGHGRTPTDMLASIRSQATTDQAVHATLSIVFGALTAVMFLFATRLNLQRFTVTAGLVAFSCAFILLVLAAITDGFVFPAIAAQCGAMASPSCVPEALTLLRLSAEQIEFQTRFALISIAIAVLSWSGALLTTPGIPRWAGLVALASGGGQLVALLLATSRLGPGTLLPIFAAQIGWYLLAAALMILQFGPFAKVRSQFPL